MSDPIETADDLTAAQVRQLAARRRQLDLDAWGMGGPPIPAHLPSPEEVARLVLARAEASTLSLPDPRPVATGTATPATSADEFDRIRAAVAEAESLPHYEQPAKLGELARWVKTRLYGHAPFSADRMTTFLLAFAWAQMQRPAGEAVNEWSRVPSGSIRSTLFAVGATTPDSGSLVPVVQALLETDRPTGELLLLSEYADQSAEILATLTGRSADDVRRDLGAARAWIEDELDLPAGAVSVD